MPLLSAPRPPAARADQALRRANAPSTARRAGGGGPAGPRDAPAATRARRVLRTVVRAFGLAVGLLLLVALVTSGVGLLRTPRVAVPVRAAPGAVVEEVTRLYPVTVAGVVAPRTTEELAEAVRASRGPVSVGGGRYSMGGQTATPGGVQLDLRQLRGVLALDTAAMTVTVRAGTTWRELQQAIDPHGLAVRIMQTYNTFTVGGSLSVNVHGRYVGEGPIVRSVESLRLVLADGSVRAVSRTESPELFYGAVGGYGGLGVIAEATLHLARNTRVRRDDTTLTLAAYRGWFARTVRRDTAVVFHNGDLYPPAYDRVHAVSYVNTTAPVTEGGRLRPADQHSAVHRAAYTVMTELPVGPWMRERVIDPLLFTGHPVTWRNYEASYDVSELEPSSRARETYVLQEYFVPVDRLDAFVARMGDVLRRHRVNVVNVSIRHALPDPGSLLAWAPVESFALVLYYKQDTDPAARRRVGAWTRELVDAALASGGRWYLPYQPHATRAQFLAGYPRAGEFFALKRQVDPAGRFTNALWDLYAPAPDGAPSAATAARLPTHVPGEVRAALDARPGYARAQTAAYLTHPEWELVYASEAYGAWLAAGRAPSRFPYAGAVGAFWRGYGDSWRAARAHAAVPATTHLMLGVIGTSTALEYGLKAGYERTLGRLGEWAAPPGGTAEDRLAAEVAVDYARFIAVRPWYEYDFAAALARLWALPPTAGGTLRRWERRLALSAEYALKTGYARVIGGGTHAVYTPDELSRELLAVGWTDSLAAAATPGLRAAAVPGRGYTVLAVPRYAPFRDALLALADHADAVRLAEVSGCETVTLTGVAPRGWTAPAGATVVTAYATPHDPTRVRVLLAVPARALLEVLREIRRDGRLAVDHVYDY